MYLPAGEGDELNIKNPELMIQHNKQLLLKKNLWFEIFRYWFTHLIYGIIVIDWISAPKLTIINALSK